MRLSPEHLWAVILALRAMGDWPRARFAASRMVAEAGDTEDPAARRLQMVSRVFLAEAMAKHPETLGDLAQAEQLNIGALAIARALATELDTPEARRDVSVSLNNVANAARARGDLAGAERLFAESLDISRALATELDTPEARRDMAISYVNMALAAEAREDKPMARSSLLEARKAAEAFSRQQPVSDAKELIAFVDAALVRLG